MLNLRVLGPLEVRSSGRLVSIPGPRLRTLLAVLIADHGQVVSIDRLAEALWGQELPIGADSTVQTYLSRLRRALDATAPGTGRVIETHAPGYRLRVDPDDIDAARFVRLTIEGRAAAAAGELEIAADRFQAALALWHGEAYAEFGDVLAVRIEADRLEEMRSTVREERIAVELELGSGVELVPEIEKLLADHPHRERLWAQLVVALFRGGRQADALAAFRRARALLIESLGVEPSAELTKVHAQVLAHDPALLPTRRPPPPRHIVDISAWPVRRRRHRYLLRAAITIVVVAAAAGTIAFQQRGAQHGRVEMALPANSVGVLDTDGAMLGAIPVGNQPTGLAYGGGVVWVANRGDNSVFEIDPANRVVIQQIAVGSAPEALAATASDVWVANAGSDTVSRINIAARQVVDTIRVGIRPDAIAAGAGGVWVANNGDNTIQRIDPATGSTSTPIDVGDGPDGIAVDRDTVWVANGRDGTVSRIDANGTEERAAPVRAGTGSKGIGLSADAVWVAGQLSRSVTRIDLSTGQTTEIAVGDGPDSIAVTGDAVWVSDRYDGTLSRIDIATSRVTTIHTGSSPTGLTAVAGQIWVAASALAAASHRGGTLTVASNLIPGHGEDLDPAHVYFFPTLEPQAAVYDGLVALRQANGANMLVPDLAEAIPQPTDGGRTYTFILRPGVRYSTGALVHAGDFALGLQRALVIGSGRPDFYAKIIGASGCDIRHLHCDLSRGVSVDESARRVTFHLEASDPEFLYKLAWFVYPAPPGTPLTPLTSPPLLLPGTGPYRIAAYVPDRVYRLERNPWFRQWSFAAQPDGYADVIQWQKTPDTRAAAAEVAAGRADLAPLTTLSDRASSGALVAELRQRYPAQLHEDPVLGATFVMLDTRISPFNDPNVRRALNWAVDRRTLVELFGGASIATPTCQLLPPGFPSYSWYCPYSTGPPDGHYHGPDMQLARDLVRQSHTTGMSVTVWTNPSGLAPPFEHYIAQVLTELGYHVSIRAPANIDALFDPSNHIQVQSYGWGADFPRVSNFYDGIVSCLNAWAYCNEAFDREATNASNLELADPGLARRLWTAIDRKVTDAAAVVPGVTSSDWRFVSTRVGNYQANYFFGGPVLSQLWVR